MEHPATKKPVFVQHQVIQMAISDFISIGNLLDTKRLLWMNPVGTMQDSSIGIILEYVEILEAWSRRFQWGSYYVQGFLVKIYASIFGTLICLCPIFLFFLDFILNRPTACTNPKYLWLTISWTVSCLKYGYSYTLNMYFKIFAVTSNLHENVDHEEHKHHKMF